jgi:hypothetical protein
MGIGRSILVALTVAAVAGVATGSAGAWEQPKTCGTAPAHANIVATDEGQTATSTGASYHYSPQGLCSSYLVDVWVPGGQKFNLTVAAPTTLVGWIDAVACLKLRYDIRIYAKGAFESALTQVAVAEYKGNWDPPDENDHGMCVPYRASGSTLYPGPWAVGGPVNGAWSMTAGLSQDGKSGFFGATYRVAFSAKLDDWLGVKVCAGLYEPYSPCFH